MSKLVKENILYKIESSLKISVDVLIIENLKIRGRGEKTHNLITTSVSLYQMV